MKTYKILSIAFIVVCLALIAGVLFVNNGAMPHKGVIIACLAVVVLVMAYNLRVISKKQKQQDRK